METVYILNIIDTVLFGLAGLWGIILLFKNTTLPWKWVALAAIIWAVTSVFKLYIPQIWDWKPFAGIQIVYLVQRIGLGLCLFLGMLTAK